MTLHLCLQGLVALGGCRLTLAARPELLLQFYQLFVLACGRARCSVCLWGVAAWKIGVGVWGLVGMGLWTDMLHMTSVRPTCDKAARL